MSKWKQVGGDRDFSGTGCTLAKVDKRSRQVELVRITPWLEMDSAALKDGYGFWDVSTKTVDYEDLGVDREDVRSAMHSRGLDEDEYKKLGPEYKAVLLADHEGYEDSTSTNDFAEALPCPFEEVEFYAGQVPASKIAEINKIINKSMRREVVTKLYGGHSSRRVPDLAALELALGDEPLDLQLDDDEAQALRYALAVARGAPDFSRVKLENAVKVDGAQALTDLLAALAAAPDSKGAAALLPLLRLGYEAHYELDWGDNDLQVASMVDDDAEAAHRLAGDILGNLGF